MRLRLLRRRLTISAPRMSVSSALAWPLRWALLALVLGFCAAIGLWAFEFGKVIAGIDEGVKEELLRLRVEVDSSRREREVAQSVADTAQTLLTAEKSAQSHMAAQIKQLELDNLALRDDLGFFEKLLPLSGPEGLGIRGLQAEVLRERQLKWSVLLFQSRKSPAEFQGALELSVVGLLNGKPWSAQVPAATQTVQFKQFGRFQGLLDLPAQAVVKSVSVKVLEGSVVKATQSVNL